MSFSFTPLSDEQIHAISNRELLPDGVYPFVVKSIEEQFSQKTGQPMLKVRIGVAASVTDERNIVDYLLPTEQMMFKLKHFCDSIGLGDKYTKGNFLFSDCIGRSGKVTIATQKGQMKPDNSGLYPDRNCVKDYVSPGDKQSKKQDDAPFKDDDINFN